MAEQYNLTLSCADRPGLVAAVAGVIAEQGGNILEAQQFNDSAVHRFFMRVVFDSAASRDVLDGAFETLGRTLGMTWELRAKHQRQRVLLLVSKFDHCLGDLLYRARIGEL